MSTTAIDNWGFLKLVYALRVSGLTISTQEIQEALKVFHCHPDLNHKIVLRSLFIHRADDIPLFDLVWRVLFENLKAGMNDIPSSQPTKPSSCIEKKADNLGGNPSQGLGTGNGGVTLYSGPESSRKVFSEFKLQNIESLIKLIGYPSKVDEVDQSQNVNFEEKVRFILGQSGFLSWSNSLELAYMRGELGEDAWLKFIDYKNSLQQEIRESLWRYRIQKENQWISLQEVNWRYKPLNGITAQEENSIHQALRQIGNNLAVRPSWKKRKASSGKICLTSAIKQMVRGNGLIYRLEFKQYVAQRPELVVLCDVSNSVAPFSQFLLYLIQRIKVRFRKVRLFLFIDTIWDISKEDWIETDDSLEQIRSWGRKDTSGYTDYGKVFKEFTELYLSEISSRATLLILGDGRNNFRPTQANHLKEIQERVRRVYWLNPLKDRDWFNQDNVIREYEPYCSKVFQCRCINDLCKIARNVF